MKYPMLCPWVELSAHADGFRLTDTKQHKQFKLPEAYVPLVRKLDGRTPPQRLAPRLTEKECNALLEQMAQHRLVRRRPAFSTGFLSLYFTIPLARPGAFGRAVAHIFNNVLLKMWLPTLVMGLLALFHTPYGMMGNHLLLGSVCGVAVGLLLHELSHACACITYGGKVHSCGLLLWLLLPGAFVELDTDSIGSPLQQAQVFAAGVEMNFFLTGMFLLLGSCSPLLGTACLCAAISNGILAMLNLTLTLGLDGMHILSALLGVDNLCTFAMDILFDREKRRQMRRLGPSGWAGLAFCGTGLAMLGIFPLVVAVNISEVLVCLL